MPSIMTTSLRWRTHSTWTNMLMQINEYRMLFRQEVKQICVIPDTYYLEKRTVFVVMDRKIEKKIGEISEYFGTSYFATGCLKKIIEYEICHPQYISS